MSVGSARFMAMEGLDLPAPLSRAMEEAHREGHSLIMVAAGGRVVGGIELACLVPAGGARDGGRAPAAGDRPPGHHLG